MIRTCKNCDCSEVELIRGNPPYDVDHWMCPLCDSTYVLNEWGWDGMIEFTNGGRAKTGICDYCLNLNGEDVYIVNEIFICDFCIDAFGRIEKGDEE